MAYALESEPDEVLLDRLTRQDTTALDALYTRYGRMAFALAYRVLGSPEAAEDVVQEAFLSIWRHAESYQQARGHARGWLLTVVRNRAIDALRAREARPKVGATLDDIQSLPADSGDPADEALRLADAATVRTALASLPPEQRETVELAFFSGLSYPEVAERTSTPLGTVKSRMRLALERLRGLLLAEDLTG
ncbi:MAG: RNA polymerase sigma factor [Dehalococcoidia bacterium]